MSGCRCGRRWIARAVAHCIVCHRTFSSNSAADRHRKASKCLDPLTRPTKNGAPVLVRRGTVHGEIFCLPTREGGHWRCRVAGLMAATGAGQGKPKAGPADVSSSRGDSGNDGRGNAVSAVSRG